MSVVLGQAASMATNRARLPGLVVGLILAVLPYLRLARSFYMSLASKSAGYDPRQIVFPEALSVQ